MLNDRVMIRLKLRNLENVGKELTDNSRASKMFLIDIIVVSNIFKIGLSAFYATRF